MWESLIWMKHDHSYDGRLSHELAQRVDHVVCVSHAMARQFADLGEKIRPHVNEQLEIAHPLIPALGHLSFVVFIAPPRVGGDARQATIVSPGRLDRSPTGTATSARVAVLSARGEMGAQGFPAHRGGAVKPYLMPSLRQTGLVRDPKRRTD